MSWAILIPIIAQYGLPTAEWLFQKWGSKTIPTAEEWAELKAIASQTAHSKMVDALTAAGIPLDSEQAKSLLAKVG